jgi:hypothetical protein
LVCSHGCISPTEDTDHILAKNTCDAMLISIFLIHIKLIKQSRDPLSLVARLPGRYIIVHLLLYSVSVPFHIFFIFIDKRFSQTFERAIVPYFRTWIIDGQRSIVLPPSSSRRQPRPTGTITRHHHNRTGRDGPTCGHRSGFFAHIRRRHPVRIPIRVPVM